MKTTRLSNLITLLALTITPLTHASGNLEQNLKTLMDCPKHGWTAHGVRYTHVTYADSSRTVSIDTTLQQARADLAAFWTSQLAATKFQGLTVAPVSMADRPRIPTVTTAGQVTGLTGPGTLD